MTDSAPVSRHELGLLDRSIADRFNGLDRWVERVSNQISANTERVVSIDHLGQKIASDLERVVNEYDERIKILEDHKAESTLRFAKLLGAASTISAMVLFLLDTIFRKLIEKIF